MNYQPGDAFAICDSCGLRFFLSELKKDWRGYMVCKDDYEPRHPQDTVKSRADKIVIDNARPEVTDIFLEPGDVTPEDL